MDLQDIKTLPEGKTLEFKRDASSAEPVLRTVCAFSNTAGGTLLFGIEDRTGAVVGIPEPLDEEERLASIIADGIAPRVLPDIEVIAWRDTHVIAVRVHPGPSRPYHVRRLGPEKGVFVRLGSTNRTADAALIAELARSVGPLGFDEQPLPELDASALDTDAVRAAFEGVRDVHDRDLLSLRLLTRVSGRTVPTVGGILLFGRNRVDRFPDAWIQAGRFKGTAKHTIMDSADIRSYPATAIDEVLSFIARNTARGMEIRGARRVEVPEYPHVAVREAVVNAVVHADYSQHGAPLRVSIFDDRLEVTSPGLLVPGLTIPDVLGGVSKLRNRVIGRVFRELGLIEQWGSGVQRILEACSDAGLPAPFFEEVGTSFRVTLYRRGTQQPERDVLDDAALDVLRAAEGLTTSEVAQAIGRSARATRTRLARLVELGLVVEIGSGPNDPQRRYHVAAEPGRYR
jgi:predicted HTH transcriptional regulator